MSDGLEPGQVWGWDSTTVIVTITTSEAVPWYTVYTTWGVSGMTVVTGGIVTVSVYTDASTTITFTPNVVTYTLFPTSKYFTSSTVVISDTEIIVTYRTSTEYSTGYESTTTAGNGAGTSTSTTTSYYPSSYSSFSSQSKSSSTRSSTSSSATSTPTPTPTVAVFSACLPGDSHQKKPGTLSLTPYQTTTFYVIAIYIVGILIGWNLFFIRHLLYPFKALVIGVHELGHVVGFIISGQQIRRVSIDPTTGGGTYIAPGVIHSTPALSLGFTFLILFGTVLTFCGFDELASKIASFIVGLAFLPTLYLQGGIFGQLSIVAAEGLMIGIWFMKHGIGLRYYILFIGVMSTIYIITDMVDDYFHRKPNACCVIVIHSHIGTPPQTLFFFWLVVALVLLAAFIIAALATWRETPHGMYCQAQTFLAT